MDGEPHFYFSPIASFLNLENRGVGGNPVGGTRECPIGCVVQNDGHTYFELDGRD
jgi:hypothetical protein